MKTGKNAFFGVAIFSISMVLAGASKADEAAPNADLDKLLDQYNEVIPDYAESLKAWSLSMHYHLTRRQFVKAAADLIVAAQVYSDYADAYCNRGLVYMNRGEQDKAIADFNEASGRRQE